MGVRKSDNQLVQKSILPLKRYEKMAPLVKFLKNGLERTLQITQNKLNNEKRCTADLVHLLFESNS